jgi:hypothetical protein
VTVPAVPSTRSRWPSAITAVAWRVPTTCRAVAGLWSSLALLATPQTGPGGLVARRILRASPQGPLDRAERQGEAKRNGAAG